MIEWRPERHYDAWIGEVARRKLFATTDLHEMNDRIDRGHDFRETVYDHAEAHPSWAREIRAWHDDWLKLAGPEIPRSVRILRALRSNGVPVFALSNFGIGSFEVAEAEWPFLGEFDRRYISGHLGLAKPDPEIYAAVEDDCGIAPDCLIFADDRAENVAAAEARGWQGHLFDGPEGWAARLVALGLLSREEAA